MKTCTLLVSVSQERITKGVAYDIVVDLDIHDMVFNPVVGVSKATRKVIITRHLNRPLFVRTLAFQEFLQECKVVGVFGSFHKDDTVKQAAILSKIALSRLA
jgi:hypothetical protein